MWTFADAKREMTLARDAQEASEKAIADAAEEEAQAKRDYQVALAVKVMQLKAAGTAVTACETIAKGHEDIAHLRYMKDLKAGQLAAAKAANYRHSANRADTLQLTRWSMAVELATNAQDDQRLAWSGGRAA